MGNLIFKVNNFHSTTTTINNFGSMLDVSPYLYILWTTKWNNCALELGSAACASLKVSSWLIVIYGNGRANSPADSSYSRCTAPREFLDTTLTCQRELPKSPDAFLALKLGTVPILLSSVTAFRVVTFRADIEFFKTLNLVGFCPRDLLFLDSEYFSVSDRNWTRRLLIHCA